jgi:integrase
MAVRKRFQALGGGRARYQYVDPLTERREDFYGTADQCEAKRQAIEHLRVKLRLGASREELRAREPAAHDRRTLDELFHLYLRRQTRASRRTYLNHWKIRISPTLGRRCPWELTADMLYEWVASLREQNYAPNTIKATAELVLMVAKTAHLSNRPWEGFHLRRAEPVRARRSLQNLEELEAVLTAARAEDERAWSRGFEAWTSVAILVAVLQGLRNAELAGLAWRDLRFDAGDPQITVARQAPHNWHLGDDGKPNGKREPDSPTKGRKARTLPLHEETTQALRLHREQLRKAGMYDLNGPVFPDEHGFWRTSGSVLRPDTVARLVKAAGLPYDAFTTHELRHTFVTFAAFWVMRHGSGDMREVQALAGHGDLKTTMPYIHRVTASQENPIPRLSVRIVPAIVAAQAEKTPPELPSSNGHGLIHGLAQLSALRSSSIRTDPPIVKSQRRSLREVAAYVLAQPLESREPVPEEVRELTRAAYQKAYNRGLGRKMQAKQRKTTPEARRLAGQKAANAVLAAWCTALGRERERMARALPAHQPIA